MKKTATLTILMLLLFAIPVLAGTTSGDKEIQLQGSFTNTSNNQNDRTTDTLSAQVGFNYFFTSNISIGGLWRGSGSVSDDGDGNETTTTTNFLLVRADLYLGNAASKVMPYVGGQAGQASYTRDDGDEETSSSSGAYGFHGGLKIFPSERISWNIELDSTTYTFESEATDDEYKSYNNSLFVGFSYYF